MGEQDRQVAELRSDVSAIAPNPSKRTTVVFVLLDRFSLLPFTSAVECLRLANRKAGEPLYDWRLCSLKGETVRASSGLDMVVHTSLEEEQRRLLMDQKPDHLIVCSGEAVETLSTGSLRTVLKQAVQRKVNIGGLCTAAWVLAEAGLLDGKRCAIHWENLASFQERFTEAHVYADLFEIDGLMHTCAGGTAALDMMLWIVGNDHGETIVSAICQQCLTDRVRSAQDRQRLPLRARIGVQNAKLLSIIELMESHVADPIAMDRIARAAGLSRRQIERLFLQSLGRSPARYYLEVRLDRAQQLLVQTGMPIIEVAVACGFVSASHFSRCYRELYGRSPQTERQLRRDQASDMAAPSASVA
ncbi:MAG: GlxA family transcriptional regulator [Pseudomonadota bacterium]